MVEISAIASALASFQAAKDIAQAMIGLRDDAAFREKLIEFQSRILDAQSAVFAANEERAALIEKVSQLEAQMAALKIWEADKKRYKLEVLPPGVHVYTLKSGMEEDEPSHHICQTCYQRGKKSVLHRTEAMNGLYHLICNECGADLRVGHSKTSRMYRSGGGPDSWMA